MKILKKSAISLGLLVALGISSQVAAASWSSVSVTLPSYMGYTYSGYATKQAANAIMSFKGSYVPVSVNMVMMNSADATRSNRLTCPSGSTATRYATEINAPQPGYAYRLRLNTSVGQTTDYYMTGSWSPDQM